MKLTVLITAAALAIVAAPAQSPDVRFRGAQQKETVEGDLRAAIQIYQEVADAKESSRSLAAQALLRVARCYEKLGSTESKKAYERLLLQFGDQVQAANEARARLAATAAPRARKPSELTATLLLHLREPSTPRDAENVATDGRTVFHFVPDGPLEFARGGALVATDISTGRQRVLLKGPYRPYGIALSPDGQRLAFARFDFPPLGATGGTWSIYVIGTDGSNPRRVFIDEKSGMRWLLLVLRTWSPDGKELIFTTGAGLSQAADEPPKYALKVLSLSDGSVRLWTDFGPISASGRPNNFFFSPDGRYLAYDVPDQSGSGARVIHLLPRSSSVSSLLIEGPGSSTVLGWTPDGKDFLFANDRRGSVDAYRAAVAEGRAREEPVLVKTNIGSARPLGFQADGSLYFINEGLTRVVKTAEFDPVSGLTTGTPRVVTQRFVDDIFVPRWSPDGSMLVYATNRNAAGRTAPVLTFRNVATGEERDVNLAPVVGSIRVGGAWSPDNTHLYVDGHALNGKAITFRVTPRTGEVKPIAPGICHQRFSNEEALLCFSREGQSPTLSLDKLDLDTGAKTHLKSGPWTSIARPPSADDRFLFYATSDSRSLRLFPLADGEERELVRATADERLKPVDWVGSEALAYRRFRNGHPAYWIRNLQTGAEVELRGMDLSNVMVTSPLFAHMSFHPNGREVVWVSDDGKNELWALQNVKPAARVSAKRSQPK